MNKLEPSKKYIATKKVFKGILYAVCSILVFIVLANAIFNLIYIETAVRGPSMLPTLNSSVPSYNEDGDIVFVNRFIQGEVGDIVVAKVPWGTGGAEVTIIKRLIAVGGDRVKFVKNGEVYEFWKNGTKQNESYLVYSQQNDYLQFCEFLQENTITRKFTIDANGYLIIPEKNVYLLGDNRSDSTDCSLMGPVGNSCIIGRVDFIVEYGSNVKINVLNIIFNIFRI